MAKSKNKVKKAKSNTKPKLKFKAAKSTKIAKATKAAKPKKAAIATKTTKTKTTAKSKKARVTAKTRVTAKPIKAAKKVLPVKSVKPVTTAAKRTSVPKVFSPLDDRVLISMMELEVKTPGGLFIPDTATPSAATSEGFVMAVGPGAKLKKGGRRPMDIRVGDRVMFNGYAGQKFELLGEQYFILRENEIFGVVG